MTEVQETVLPGVGIRYDFESESGRRIGVVHRRSGRRELLIYDEDDPDSCREVVRLDDEDGQALAELLGGTKVAGHLARLQQRIEGLAIDWLPLTQQSPFAQRPLGDTEARSRTGVSIVAVLRGEEAFPAPGPAFRLRGGDTLVVVGTPRGIEELVVLLRAG